MRRFWVLCAVSSLAATGCDELEKAGNENVLVFTLLQSPDFALPDGSTAAGATIATVFYGKRDPANLQAPPTGVPGATVTVKWSGKSCRLADKGQGAYLGDSSSDPGCGELRPLQEVDYTVEVINDQNETFTGTVRPPPATTIQEFESTDAFCSVEETSDVVRVPRCREHQKGEDFVITRADPATGDALTDPSKNDLGFYAVYKLGTVEQLLNGQIAKIDPKNPDATNFPRQPVELLKLVAADADYRRGTYTIPGETFDADTDTAYGVALLVAKRGTTSNNVFLGSVAMAGHGSGGLLRVRP